MTIKSPIPALKVPLCLGLTSLAMALSAFGSNSEAVAYDFDDTCAPQTSHTVYTKRPPLLMVMDRSGSMNGQGNAAGDSKLTIAKLATSEAALSVSRTGPCEPSDIRGCDLVLLGLGWFSTDAGVSVEPGEDKVADIISNVLAYFTNGATYVGKAAKIIHDDSSLSTNTSVGIGVIITDGAPWASSEQETKDTVEEALMYLCDARDRDPGQTLTFTVGFGQGASPRMNSLFAAAGGTGQCCKNPTSGGTCSYQPSEILDPCDLARRANGFVNAESIVQGARSNVLASNIQCEGTIQADNGQDLKDAFLGILARSACTFPLEIPPNYPAGLGADPDPEATNVLFSHRILGTDIEAPYVGDFYTLDPSATAPLPNPGPPSTVFRDYLLSKPNPVEATIADGYIGEGWLWANPQRTAIIMTPNLCQDVVYKYDVTEVLTQVACLCENTDESCEVPCYKENGKCSAANGCDALSGAAQTACLDTHCKYHPESKCEEGLNELYGRRELQQVGRCSPGIIECVIGKEYCVPDYAPQPEICNGRDDSCSGSVDDVSTAQDSSEPNTWYNAADPVMQAALTNAGMTDGAFCGFKDDACGCDGAADSYGISPKLSGNGGFQLLLEEAAKPDSTCGCVETLEGSEGAQIEAGGEAPLGEDPQSGGCSSTSHDSPAPLIPLALLGLVGLLRRRRR